MRLSYFLIPLALSVVHVTAEEANAASPREDLWTAPVEQIDKKGNHRIVAPDMTPEILSLKEKMEGIMNDIQQRLDDALAQESAKNGGESPTSIKDFVDRMFSSEASTIAEPEGDPNSFTGILPLIPLLNESYPDLLSEPLPHLLNETLSHLLSGSLLDGSLSVLLNGTLLNHTALNHTLQDVLDNVLRNPGADAPTGLQGQLKGLAKGLGNTLIGLLFSTLTGLLSGLGIPLSDVGIPLSGLRISLSGLVQRLGLVLGVLLVVVASLLAGFLKRLGLGLALTTDDLGSILRDIINILSDPSNPTGAVLAFAPSLNTVFGQFIHRLADILSLGLKSDPQALYLFSLKVQEFILNLLRYKSTLKIIISTIKDFIQHIAVSADDTTSQAIRDIIPTVFSATSHVQASLSGPYMEFVDNHPKWKIVGFALMQVFHAILKIIIRSSASFANVFSDPSPENIDQLLHAVANVTNTVF